MHLIKWFRKNRTKLIAVVVIVIMTGFIGGSYITQCSQRRAIGIHKAVARLKDGAKVTRADLARAGRELGILKSLRAPMFLSSQNISSIILGELLFAEGGSRQYSAQIKRFVKSNQYRISDKQVNDIYRRAFRPEIYWFLLTEEARRMGIYVDDQRAGKVLGELVPQLFDGAGYQDVIARMMKGGTAEQGGISEGEILSAFAKLLGVVRYGSTICSSEAVTPAELKHSFADTQGSIDANFVEISAEEFVSEQKEPSRDEIMNHFEKYRNSYPGEVNESNPYGFGYKLAPRARLDYLIVKRDDVGEIIEPPSQGEAERFYQRYRKQFTEEVPSDPNDPNSEPTERIQTYAEVADDILNSIEQRKIDSEAKKIIEEVKNLTAKPEGRQNEVEFVDYETAAQKLSEEYGIPVYAGRTGMLTGKDIRMDPNLGSLYLMGYTRGSVVPLARVVLAVEGLEATELGPFEVPRPEMGENVGPFDDMGGKIKAMVRVVEAEPAETPPGIDYSCSKKTVELDGANEIEGKAIYSVKEEVIKDLKRLKGIEKARSAAQKLKLLVAEHGWDKGIEKLNKLYGDSSPNEPNTFRLQSYVGMQQISARTLATLRAQTRGGAVAQIFAVDAYKRALLTDKLYSLIPGDSKVLQEVPHAVEFKPEMTVYVIKNLSVRRPARQEYLEAKTSRLYAESSKEAQTMVVVHFNPENIVKRTGFEYIRKVPAEAVEEES